MNLPTFEMIINPDETSDVEVSFVALVEKPAIESNFLMFNALPLNFALNTEKRIISGPAMVADSLIYRRDENGEYNVFFSKETIREIAIKFFKKDYQKNLNLFHDPTLSLEGVTIFESFVSDKDRGIHPMKGFEALPDGTWFISAKIDNEEVWNKVKSGEVKGFSVEGIFSYVKKGQQTMEESIYKLLYGTLFEKSLFNKKDIMSGILDSINDLKQKFFGDPSQTPAAPVEKMAEYTLVDGTAVSITDLAAGGVVTVGDIPVPAGDYELSDGTKFTVSEGGVISAMADTAAPAEPAEDYSSKFAAYDEKFTVYEQKFADQEGMLNKLSTSFAKTNETIVHLVGIIEKMAAEPTAEPTSQSQNTFQSQKSQSREEKRKEFAQLFAKIKNK